MNDQPLEETATAFEAAERLAGIVESDLDGRSDLFTGDDISSKLRPQRLLAGKEARQQHAAGGSPPP